MVALIPRPFWIRKFHQSWKKRPVIWLHGVRRVGKTSLAKLLGDVTYLNCDLPSVQRKLEDPEAFYHSLKKDQVVVFDEIHRLSDPSRILKISSDEFPEIKVLATGSSTLEATKKFKDTLTGRKSAVYLPPVLWNECQEVFEIKSLERRLLHGGLPEPLLADEKDPEFFSEWMDSFFARDIQELFNIRNREGYMRLMQLIYRSSGELMEITNLSKLTGLTRPTVQSYLESLKISNNIYPLPPFHKGGKREITQRPKVYAFDTGFVTYAKGWNELREEDKGLLWEHLVLDLLRTHFSGKQLYYWRDQSEREIDFVIPKNSRQIDVIECKINPDHFSGKNIGIFRERYPDGRNYCFCPFIREKYSVRHGANLVIFTGGILDVQGSGI